MIELIKINEDQSMLNVRLKWLDYLSEQGVVIWNLIYCLLGQSGWIDKELPENEFKEVLR